MASAKLDAEVQDDYGATTTLSDCSIEPQYRIKAGTKIKDIRIFKDASALESCKKWY